ncbi:hypothetical protein DEO72_LG1g922 [Vigna unguiculata]|uniref:Uncharacterized protein n=1 Tax=Vigna unguiculata TaxID=3917 RepID=A0A4D6KQC4_VIGUN|nr:hypothetical protein DEO72_LG1g922 [Vigna unguiculata]
MDFALGSLARGAGRGVVDLEANPIRVSLPALLVQVGRIFFRRCLMACFQTAGVLITSAPLTRRGRVLLDAQPSTWRAIASLLGYTLGAILVGMPDRYE